MSTHKIASGRIFWGLLIILIGVLFLLDQMGQLDFGSIISRYWPLILILAGIWHLIANNFRDAAGGLFMIIIGGFFMLMKLEILGRSAWHYFWPLIIIAVGLLVLLGSTRLRSSEKMPSIKGDDLDAFVIFSGLNRKIESQNFRGGKATALMGGMDLDFTPARLEGGKASIELTAILGGIGVRVPRTWRVKVEGGPVLGGIEEKHQFTPGPEEAPVLFIKATAILGGIEIKD